MESGTQAPVQTTNTAEIPPTTPSSTAPAAPVEGEPNAGAPGGATNEGKWDNETRDYIQSLRKENAKYRNQSKTAREDLGGVQKRLDAITGAVTGNEEGVDPEEALRETLGFNDQLVARNAILEAAIENNVPKDKLDYFAFKIESAASELEEGEELDPMPIAQEVLKIGMSPDAPGGATTGIPNGGKTPAPAGSGTLNVEAFKKMSFLDKSRLQMDNPEVYQKLKAESTA